MGDARTRYRGVGFASALHAHWAAFFDACAWEWWYQRETIKGFSPDFLLSVPSHDYVRVHVVAVRTLDTACAYVRPLFRDFVGDLLVVRHRPTPELGAIVRLPAGRWRVVAFAELADGNASALWNEAAGYLVGPPPKREPSCSPENYGGEILVDWRARGEAFAAKWGTIDQIRDWGLIIARLGEVDATLAGVLAGADKAVFDEDVLEVWLPRSSVRGRLLEAYGARSHDIVKDALGLDFATHYREAT